MRAKNYKTSLFASFIAVLLGLSLFAGVFMPSVAGQTTFNVGTEAELRAAVINAVNGEPVNIVLDKGIALTATLTIPASKDITLKSNGDAEFELFGASGMSTIAVLDGGILTLDGIVVTHVRGAVGRGVDVYLGGRLVLTSGKIYGNTDGYGGNGGGVSNAGEFNMYGGVIANNALGIFHNSDGGGVSNSGNFNLYGGEISNNSVGNHGGGGVGNSGVFSMFGGRIFGNGAYDSGGGVANYNVFTMSGGEIFDNTAIGLSSSGGGGVLVYNMFYVDAVFTMTGGKISGNTANYGGGVYVRDRNLAMCSSSFVMVGGEISNNTASIFSVIGNVGGGGVFADGDFTMLGGAILNNHATDGGGIYVTSGYTRLSGGTISGNTAARNGGGVGIAMANLGRLFVSNGVVFSNNSALASYNRDPAHDAIYKAYIADSVVWSEPFTQGYNNYDISYVYGTSITSFSVIVNDGYGAPTGAGSYPAGATVTLNAGMRAGYTFSRWIVNEGSLVPSSVVLSNVYSSTATFTMPTNNVVITASWTVIQYNIRYTLNGGINAAGNPATYNAGSSFPIAIANPTRANYEFRGWNVTYADGTQSSFQSSYSIPSGTTGSIDLVANWDTPSTGNGSGGNSGGGSSSGGSSSGGSSSSIGSGSSNNSGNSGSDNNNTPPNRNDNSRSPDDNQHTTTENNPQSENLTAPITINWLIIALSIIGLFVVVGLVCLMADGRKKQRQHMP